MFARVRSGSLALGAVLLSACLLPRAARADHDSFEHRGLCTGCAGEQEMIAALRYLEETRCCESSAARYIGPAVEKVCRAADLVCDRRAKIYLLSAQEHLDAFLYRGHRCDLCDAALLVQKALAAEQAHRDAGNSGYVGGDRFGFGRPSAPPVGYPRAYGYEPPRPRSGLYIGGKHGGLFFKF